MYSIRDAIKGYVAGDETPETKLAFEVHLKIRELFRLCDRWRDPLEDN